MGHPHLRLLYTTPETLFGARYESYFQKCYQQRQMVRMVIDEVGWSFSGNTDSLTLPGSRY